MLSSNNPLASSYNLVKDKNGLTTTPKFFTASLISAFLAKHLSYKSFIKSSGVFLIFPIIQFKTFHSFYLTWTSNDFDGNFASD